MNGRRFLRTLLLTCWIPILGGVVATWWFSRQEPAGASYECSAKLTSEHWMDYYRRDPLLSAFATGYGTPAETAISFFTKRHADKQIRDALAGKSGARNESPVEVEADEVDKAVIELRVAGPDAAFIQAYLKQSVIAYEEWSKKLADALQGGIVEPLIRVVLENQNEVKKLDERLRGMEAGSAEVEQLKRDREAALERQKDWEKKLETADSDTALRKKPVTFLEGPGTPTKVKIPMSEAIVMGSLFGGGVGVCMMVLIALMSLSRYRQRPVNALP